MCDPAMAADATTSAATTDRGGHSLLVAYLLWFFCPLPGTHHLYLGRDNHAALHLLTFGGLGFAWLRDLFYLPRWVDLANGRVLPRQLGVPRMGVMLFWYALNGSPCRCKANTLPFLI